MVLYRSTLRAHYIMETKTLQMHKNDEFYLNKTKAFPFYGPPENHHFAAWKKKRKTWSDF